jgi:hypothetical protein
MAVRPIEAKCDNCGETFALLELRERRTGQCPRCMRHLASDWTPKLLHDAARAEVALTRLVESLRSLRKLPTSMQVLPTSVMRSLFEETGWDEQIATSTKLAESELPEIRRMVSKWERLAPGMHETAPRTRRRSFRFGRTARSGGGGTRGIASTDPSRAASTRARTTEGAVQDRTSK